MQPDHITDKIGFIRKIKLPSNVSPFGNKVLPNLDKMPEDFRIYLLKHGVIDYLTKYFTKLQEERPENPLESLLLTNQNFRIKELKKLLEKQDQKIELLENENKQLKYEIAFLQMDSFESQ